MEEVDGIILINLRQIGCEIPEGKDRIDDFDTDVLVRCVSHCLNVMGDGDFPSYGKAALPPEMSSRFRVGQTIADAVKKMGYKEELGFHQFLYPNPKDSRMMLSFLVEQLPKAEQQEEESIGGSALLLTNAVSEIGRAKAQPFIPYVCRPVSLSRCLATHQRSIHPARALTTERLVTPASVLPKSGKNKETEAYIANFLPFITQQVSDPHFLAPSVFERNSNAVAEAAEMEKEWNSLVEGGKTAAEVKKARREAFAKLLAEALRSRARGANAGATASSSSQLLSLQEILAEIEAARKSAGATTAFTRAAQFTQEDDDGVDVGLSREDLARMSREERQRAREERERAAREKKQRENEDKEKEQREAQEAELATLNANLSRARTVIEQMEQDIELQTSTLRQLEDKIITEGHENEALMEEYKIKHKTIGLLKDRDNNLAELRSLSAASARRLVELAAEWEKHRVPLIEKIRQNRESITQRKEDLKWKLERVKEMREEMKRLITDIRERDELVKALFEELSKLPKNIQRGGYTRRIMEIMKNIEKQKIDIDKILADTRSTQKEINANVETLNRSYAATDELVYRDATVKGEPASKRCYKLLVGTHESFGRLTACVEETGSVTTQIRDLEAKMEQAQLRSNVLNMERVVSDLKQIKTENAALQKKLGGAAVE